MDNDSENEIDSNDDLMIDSSNSRKRKLKDKEGKEPPKKKRRKDAKNINSSDKTKLMEAMRHIITHCPVLKRSYLVDAMRRKMYDSIALRISLSPQTIQQNSNSNDLSCMKDKPVYPPHRYVMDSLNGVKYIIYLIIHFLII